ncbi:hypothetical protein P2G88_09015 [Aliiglaciecola sp. CAU 1673]|uniref:hypothetical protein n=1 Tax=Aliiglaciecola sp. CAU 1673 TaxID=3032595 RepID=UPI0023DAA354|nr:hypothetical protein [Aliiglaciecola sp. CAU 1673]MDF2178391.1 hypothetical protein [Aliiglaciecola sp. CAU 1673]
MNLAPALIGLSLYILIWEKLPDWGNWFNAVLARLPKPLAYLYEAWRCPYCFGFWCALALHFLSGLYTLDSLAQPVEYLGLAGTPIAWFLDALATALLMMLGSLLLKALAVPAIKGQQMTEAFRQAHKQGT